MASFHTTTITTSALIRNTIPLFTLPVKPAIHTLVALEAVPALAHRLLHAPVLFAEVALAFIIVGAFATLGSTGTREAFQNGFVVPGDDASAFVAPVCRAVGVDAAFAAFFLLAIFRGSCFNGSADGQEAKEEEGEESEGK